MFLFAYHLYEMEILSNKLYYQFYCELHPSDEYRRDT